MIYQLEIEIDEEENEDIDPIKEYLKEVKDIPYTMIGEMTLKIPKPEYTLDEIWSKETKFKVNQIKKARKAFKRVY